VFSVACIYQYQMPMKHWHQKFSSVLSVVYSGIKIVVLQMWTSKMNCAVASICPRWHQEGHPTNIAGINQKAYTLCTGISKPLLRRELLMSKRPQLWSSKVEWFRNHLCIIMYHQFKPYQQLLTHHSVNKLTCTWHIFAGQWCDVFYLSSYLIPWSMWNS